ncbi:MAG: sigma-70 family RNA polymerase sigma factor [Phycisphaerales bacterium]|nr:sigma-70 family RNA polymerase sigma factor [Phycisphaerales bacterium]
MIDLTRTTTQLLEGLRHSDDAEAWMQFERRYRALLHNFARKLGLSDADAEDAAQEAITRFITEYRQGKYDREKGQLRAWLIGIVRYRVLEARRRQARNAQPLPGDDLLEDEQGLTRIWDQERREHILRNAMEQLRTQTSMADKTLNAFDLLVTRQMSPKDVAQSLGMSVHDVYLAKNRCATRLREFIEQLETVYDAEQ